MDKGLIFFISFVHKTFCREIRYENCICSRGIRKAYSEAFQTEMMNDAYKQWYQLEKDYGERLLKYFFLNFVKCM